jgi:uncharacterized protein involved in exopolysaccharide biosynthesis
VNTPSTASLPDVYAPGTSPNGSNGSHADRIDEPERTDPPRARRWYVRLGLVEALITLLGAEVGLEGTQVIPATYAARAEVHYPITEEQPTGFLREDRNLTTQLVLMRSSAVLGPAAACAGVELADLDDNITVSLVDSSEIIQLEVQASSPESALRQVNSVLTSYLAVTADDPGSSALRYMESRLEEIRSRIESTEEDLATLRSQQAGGGVDAQLATRSGELETLVASEQELQGQLDQMQIIERSGPNAEPITQPYMLPTPVSPSPTILTATGGLTGLVIAACFVALALRRRIGS